MMDSGIIYQVGEFMATGGGINPIRYLFLTKIRPQINSLRLEPLLHSGAEVSASSILI